MRSVSRRGLFKPLTRRAQVTSVATPTTSSTLSRFCGGDSGAAVGCGSNTITGRFRFEPDCSVPLVVTALLAGAESLDASSVESLRRVGVDLGVGMSGWGAGLMSAEGVAALVMLVGGSCTEARVERPPDGGFFPGDMLSAGKVMGLNRPLLDSLCSSGGCSSFACVSVSCSSGFSSGCASYRQEFVLLVHGCL